MFRISAQVVLDSALANMDCTAAAQSAITAVALLQKGMLPSLLLISQRVAAEG